MRPWAPNVEPMQPYAANGALVVFEPHNRHRLWLVASTEERRSDSEHQHTRFPVGTRVAVLLLREHVKRYNKTLNVPKAR
jgi:hypothetical protein